MGTKTNLSAMAIEKWKKFKKMVIAKRYFFFVEGPPRLRPGDRYGFIEMIGLDFQIFTFMLFFGGGVGIRGDEGT